MIRRLLVLAFFLTLFAAAGASAQIVTTGDGCGTNGLPCEQDFEWNLDPVAAKPKYETCPARINLAKCLERCACQLRNNKKRCGQQLNCLQLAFQENEICEASCWVDFTT